MDRRLLLAPLLVALAACGQDGPLRPADGSDLPPQPALATERPDAEALLTAPPIARPERVDELVRQSTPRQPDPFDLPPPEGGAAPAPSPESEDDDDIAPEEDPIP
ncbi:hypothetical protein [Sphingomicrobium sediminis]|uniref:Uncharacterized protein n=1 Tax=Sphingomicrobium sediminis TaxID=2950949 RepID=A0A9X2EI18_9SPHN|nr:hypothetical protein [Sphingomicrobium sediminis]MCM8557932.1 hypothetical protein [Sphingomicrobium sediminis]